jgi:hypothetical protein
MIGNNFGLVECSSRAERPLWCPRAITTENHRMIAVLRDPCVAATAALRGTVWQTFAEWDPPNHVAITEKGGP